MQCIVQCPGTPCRVAIRIYMSPLYNNISITKCGELLVVDMHQLQVTQHCALQSKLMGKQFRCACANVGAHNICFTRTRTCTHTQSVNIHQYFIVWTVHYECDALHIRDPISAWILSATCTVTLADCEPVMLPHYIIYSQNLIFAVYPSTALNNYGFCPLVNYRPYYCPVN